jgi:hypothetical protein
MLSRFHYSNHSSAIAPVQSIDSPTHYIREMCLSLAASAPDILQQTISLCQSVQGIIGLSHRANETAKSIDLALTSESTVLIDLSNGDLDGCVILGLDDSVGSAALSWDVAVEELC